MSKLAPKSVTKLDKSKDTPRFGTIEEIANCALYLTTKSAEYINGETIVVAGTTNLRVSSYITKEKYELYKKIRKSKL